MDDKLNNITLNEGTNFDSDEGNILTDQIKKIDNDICDEEYICWVNAAKILKRSNQFFWPAIILPIVSLKDQKYKTIVEEFYKKPGYVVIQLLGYLKLPNTFCVSANHVFHIRLEKHNPMDYYSERIETSFQYEMTYFHIGILLLQATINHIKYDFEDENGGDSNNNNNNNTDPFPIDTELSEIFTHMEESESNDEMIIDETEITTIIDNNDSPSDSSIEEEKEENRESEEEREKEIERENKEKERQKKKLHIEKKKKAEKVVVEEVEEKDDDDDDETTSDDGEEEFSLKNIIPNKNKLKKVENGIKNNRIRMKNKDNGKNNNKSNNNNNNNNKSKIRNINKSGNVISNKPFKTSPPSRNRISLIPKSKATQPLSQPKTIEKNKQQQQQQPTINKEKDKSNDNNIVNNDKDDEDEVTHEVIYADDDDDNNNNYISNSLPLPPSPTPISNNNSDDDDNSDNDSDDSSNDLAPDPPPSTFNNSSPNSLPLPPDLHPITTIPINTTTTNTIQQQKPINTNKSQITKPQTIPTTSDKSISQKRKLPSSLSLPPQPSLLSSTSSSSSNISKLQGDDSPIEHQLIYTDSVENEDTNNNNNIKISEVDSDLPLPPPLPPKSKEITPNKSILIQPTLTQNYSNKFDSLNRNNNYNNIQKQSKTSNELRPIPNQPLVQPPPPPKEKITKSPSTLSTPPPTPPLIPSSSLPNKIPFRKNLPLTRQFTGITIPKNKITPKQLQLKSVKQPQQQSQQPAKQSQHIKPLQSQSPHPAKPLQQQPQLVKNTVKQIPILPSRLPLPLHKQNILSSRLTINKEKNTISKPINTNTPNNIVVDDDDITIKRVSPLSSSSNNSPFRRVSPSPKTQTTTQMYKKVTPLPPSALSSNNNKRNSVSLDSLDNSSKMVKQAGKTMLVKRKDTSNLITSDSEENPTKRQKIQESPQKLITLKPPITPILDTSNAFSPVNNNNNSNNNNAHVEFSGLPPPATFSPTVTSSSSPSSSSPLKLSSNHLPNQQNSSSLLPDLQEIDNNNNIINSNTQSPLFAAFDLSPTIEAYNNNNNNSNNNNNNNNKQDLGRRLSSFSLDDNSNNNVNNNNNNNNNMLDNILDNQDSISSSSPSPQQQSHTATLLDYKDVQNPFISNNNNHLSTQFQDIVLSTSNDKQQQQLHPSFSPNKPTNNNNNPNTIDIIPIINQSKSPILPIRQSSSSSTSSSPATQPRKPLNLLRSIMQKQSQKNQSSSTPTSQTSPIQPAKLSPSLTSQLVSSISSPPLPAMSPPQKAIPPPPPPSTPSSSTASQLNLDDYNNNDIELSYEASDSENNTNNNNNSSSIKPVDSTDFDFVNTDLLSPPFSPTPNVIKSISDNSSIQSQYTSFSPVITQPKDITSTTINSNNNSSNKLEELELPPAKKLKVDYSPSVDISNLKKNDKVYYRSNNGEEEEGEGEISSFNGSRGIMIRTLDNKYIQLKRNDLIGIDKNSLHDVSNFIQT